MENNDQIQENNKACYENPFVYGLIHTPINRSEFYKADYDGEYVRMNEADAFAFIQDQLCEEYENDYNKLFAGPVPIPVPIRTFDLAGRQCLGFRTWHSHREVDFIYTANTLADLFEYSEGEQFYHTLTVDYI